MYIWVIFQLCPNANALLFLCNDVLYTLEAVKMHWVLGDESQHHANGKDSLYSSSQAFIRPALH